MTKTGHIHQDYKERAIHRLKIISGQIAGLEKMVGSEDYCVDILNQSLSIQESLKSFDALMLENHITTHLTHQLQGEGKADAVKEMLKLYRLKN